MFTVDYGGYLHPVSPDAPELIIRACHPSRYHSGYAMPSLDHGPEAIIAHYTATAAGTALAMANKRRDSRLRRPLLRLSSWHVTIPVSGWNVVQMIPFDRGAYHAGVDKWNRCAVGIEFEGWGEYSPSQMELAKLVYAAIIEHYDIPMSKALMGHSDVKPGNSDPGPEFYDRVAPAIRDHVMQRRRCPPAGA